MPVNPSVAAHEVSEAPLLKAQNLREQSVVAQLTTRVAIMQAGHFVELGRTERVLSRPEHSYTQVLLAAVPQIPA